VRLGTRIAVGWGVNCDAEAEAGVLEDANRTDASAAATRSWL
jgi:hypothetical protein